MAESVDAASAADRLVRWLLEDRSRALPLQELVPELVNQLASAGTVLSRISFSVPTRHPLLWIQNIAWTRVRGVVVQNRPHEFATKPVYLDSPVAVIHRGGGAVRRRLTDPQQLDYPICRDIRADGGTDYLGLPLQFGDGRISFVAFASDQPEGFTDADVALLMALLPVLSMRVELHSVQVSSRHLLEVYLGQNAAHSVLGGSFHRGTGRLLRAAIWFCDLRGFTALSDSRPPLEVVVALDAYFDRVASAIASRGGEVLKFIGDAVLAIFPVQGDDEAAACRRAMEAAHQGLAAMNALNVERGAGGQSLLDLGMAVHVGDVMYGNIGASDRLDFTVIGASVNEVCRLESLCKPLKTRFVCSAAVARHCPEEPLVSLGSHALKGVSAPQEVFSLAAYQLRAA